MGDGGNSPDLGPSISAGELNLNPDSRRDSNGLIGDRTPLADVGIQNPDQAREVLEAIANGQMVETLLGRSLFLNFRRERISPMIDQAIAEITERIKDEKTKEAFAAEFRKEFYQFLGELVTGKAIDDQEIIKQAQELQKETDSQKKALGYDIEIYFLGKELVADESFGEKILNLDHEIEALKAKQNPTQEEAQKTIQLQQERDNLLKGLENEIQQLESKSNKSEEENRRLQELKQKKDNYHRYQKIKSERGQMSEPKEDQFVALAVGLGRAVEQSVSGNDQISPEKERELQEKASKDPLEAISQSVKTVLERAFVDPQNPNSQVVETFLAKLKITDEAKKKQLTQLLTETPQQMIKKVEEISKRLSLQVDEMSRAMVKAKIKDVAMYSLGGFLAFALIIAMMTQEKGR